MQHALPESTADLLVVDALGVRGGRLRIVNVYNAPTGGNSLRQGDGIRALSTASLDARQVPTVVAGDFNAFHTDWSTEATSNKRGASGIKLKSWAMAGAWQLGLEVGTVTRRGSAGEQDSAIDLVFKSKALTDSGWEARSSARIDLATGSDHYPVRPLNFKRTNWERFTAAIGDRQGELDASMRALLNARTETEAQESLDAAFEELQRLLTSCLEASTPRCKGSSAGCQFWDAECDEKLDAMRRAELELA
ncbi:hypothetical protein A4X03_0g3225, partial [Tilletia caries]